MPIVVGYQIDSKTQVTKPTGATDPVKVGLAVFGEVKIDDNIHRLNVDSSGKQVYKKT
jgi:hypothetical protein